MINLKYIESIYNNIGRYLIQKHSNDKLECGFIVLWKECLNSDIYAIINMQI